MADGAPRPEYSLSLADSASTRSEQSTTQRLPLEYAFALDRICATFDPQDRVYVGTESSSLLQAMAHRHGGLVAHTAASDDIQTAAESTIDSIEDPADLSDAVDRVVLLGSDVALIREVIAMTATQCRHDCLVGNPYSFNRIEDRTVDEWVSPRSVLRLYKQHGYDTALAGYHGPRSIVQSLAGRVWQTLGRPDKRDVYTHRMRDRYREETRPLALLSCLVHVQAYPGAGDA